MPAGVWKALAGIIAALLLAVVALDQWQARHGLASVFWNPGRPAAEARPVRTAPTLPPAPRVTEGAPRLAIIVDDLGSRRDVFDLVRELGRPVAVGVLPDLPLSAWIAGRPRGSAWRCWWPCPWSRTATPSWIRGRARS